MKCHSRFVATLLMLGVVTMMIGGSLAAPASALPGGTNICEHFSATLNIYTATSVTGTLSGCHQQGSGTTFQVVDAADPYHGTVQITWATGHATSWANVTVIPDLSNPCEPADPAPFTITYTGNVVLTITSGPYAGSTGGYVQCTTVNLLTGDATGGNVGPVVI